MSNSIESTKDYTEEQMAAFQLIDENKFLNKDPYVRRVVENNGIADSGEKVDIGDFLAMRLAVLEKNQTELKLAALIEKNPSTWQVVNSIRPDLEN